MGDLFVFNCHICMQAIGLELGQTLSTGEFASKAKSVEVSVEC